MVWRTLELGTVDLDVLVTVLPPSLRFSETDGADGRMREDDAANEEDKPKVNEDASKRRKRKRTHVGMFS